MGGSLSKIAKLLGHGSLEKMGCPLTSWHLKSIRHHPKFSESWGTAPFLRIHCNVSWENYYQHLSAISFWGTPSMKTHPVGETSFGAGKVRRFEMNMTVTGLFMNIKSEIKNDIYHHIYPHFFIFSRNCWLCIFFLGVLLYRPIISGIWTQALHGKGARCHRGAIAFAGRALQGPGLRRPESKKVGYMERWWKMHEIEIKHFSKTKKHRNVQ